MKSLFLAGLSVAVAFSALANEPSFMRTKTELQPSATTAISRFKNVQEVGASREVSKAKLKEAHIKEATSAPAAYYKRPSGTYYIGLSPLTYSLNNKFLSIPAFTELKWANASVGATSIQWEYCNGILPDSSDYSYTQSTANEITTPEYLAGNSYPAPYLMAQNALGDSIFTTVDYLSTSPNTYIESVDQYFYNTNMRPDAEIIAYLGATMINNSQSAAPLDNRYGFTDAGYTDVKLDAVAELFRKPAKPYLLSSICAHLCDLNAGSKPLNVRATVYSVTLDEYGNVAQLGKVLYTGSGDNSMYSSGRQWQTVLWNNVTSEDAAGRPTDLIIDDNILIVLEAEDEATSFAQYLWASPSALVADDLQNTTYDDVCSYVIASASLDGQTQSFVLPYAGAWYMDDNVTVGAMKSFPIQILAETYYLGCDDTEFIADTDKASSKTFAINSFYTYEAWSIYAEGSNGEEADWIEFGVENVMDSVGNFVGVVNLTLTTSALPQGVAGREANVEISYMGASLKIHIVQGENGSTGEPKPDPDANSMYINDVTTFCGKTATLSLQMKNNFEVVGFQCDFYAPAGTSVAVDEYGYNMIELSTERTNPKNTNFFDSALQSDGSIRILASSTKNIAISGTSGEVATIVLNVGADLEGEYPLILRNIVLSDANGNAYILPDTQAVLTVKSYILGDANGDGNINVGDYSMIASYILGRTLDNFVKEAADTNEDGIINVGDLSGLVRMILGGAKAPALAPQVKATDVSEYENAIYGVDAIVNSDGTAVMSMCMKNSIAVPGYQFDFLVPEGFELVKDEWGYYLIELSTERTNPRDTNLFDYADQTDGSIRVLCSSSRNATFSGNDGEVCTIKFKMKEGVTAGSYDVKFKNIVMADTEGQSHVCKDVNVALIVTENVGAQMAKSDGAEIEAIYGVDGVKRNGMQQGVNIIRYTDGTTKKVMVK